MNCQQLANLVEAREPAANPSEVARLCLLLTNQVDDLEHLADERHLEDAWAKVGLRLQAATDQHAAMTQELEELANSDPDQFSPERVWTLVRAIKVQSQILQMYLGGQPLDV